MLNLAVIVTLLLPLQGEEVSQDETHSRGQIAWLDASYEQALEEAGRRDALVLVEFWADWCGWCKQHERDNLTDEQVARTFERFVCFGADLSVDDDGNFFDDEAAALMKRFAVRRFPTLLFVRPDGTPEDIVSGFLPKEMLLREIERIERGERTLGYFETKMAQEPGELEWRWQYAVKLDALGDTPGFQREVAHIQAKDPEKASIPMRRMALRTLTEVLWGCMRDPEIEPDPAELETFIAKEKHPELLCDAWLLMGAVRGELGEAEASLSAYRSAWAAVPIENLPAVGNGIAWAYWTRRDELSDEDKRFALLVAIDATRELEKRDFDPLVRAMYYDTLACCYYMNGKSSKAVRLMQRCVEADPSSQGYADRLAHFEARG